MARLSNLLVALLNFLSILASIPMLAAGIWIAVRHPTDCLRFLQWPLIALGLLILLVSLIGVIGSFFRVAFLLSLYLALLIILIIVLVAVTVFALVVLSRGSGVSVNGRQYQEYHLDRYSQWLQTEVSKAANWEKIKACIQDAKVCNQLNVYTDSSSFYNANLSPLQSGCCKPPSDCNFTFVSATVWNAPVSAAGLNNEQADCKAWSNDPSQLCYDCDSCRAGAIENLRVDWRKAAIVDVVALLFLIVVYSLGCCAFNNVKIDAFYKKQARYQEGYPKGLAKEQYKEGYKRGRGNAKYEKGYQRGLAKG